MSSAVTSQLYALAIMALLIGPGVLRRMRPQQVRPGRLLVGGAVIVVVIGLSLVGAGGRIIEDPVALLLIPLFVAAGVALGYYLVRTMTFWSDPATGSLWMRGGALFALILIATVSLRLVVRGLAYGSVLGPPTAAGGSLLAPQATGHQGLLYDLSADLLFLSLGLWLARAYLLVQRHRAHQAASAAR